MISPMNSIEVAGALHLFDRAVDVIQEQGVLHIEEIPLAQGAGPDLLHRIRLSPDQDREREELMTLLGMLDEGVGRMPQPVLRELRASPAAGAEYAKRAGESLAVTGAGTRMLHTRIRSLVRRERNLEDDLRVLSSYEEVSAALAPLLEGSEIPENFEFLGIILEKGNLIAGRLLVNEIEAVTRGKYRYYRTGFGRGRAAALVGYPKEMAPDVKRFIEKLGIAEMSFPRYLRDRPFEEALASIEEDLAALREKRKELLEQTEEFYRENGLRLLALQAVVKDLHSRYEEVGKFVRTAYTFVIRGWIPRERFEGFTRTLREKVGDQIVVRKIRAGMMGKPPVLLRNPPVLSQFQPLIRLFPLPKYGSIDPTFFVALFFPPMFGLMLGDVGYGLFVAVLAVLFRRLGRTRPILRALSTVAWFCAAFTIGFGFVFGEFFGDAGHRLGLKPLWKERFSLSDGNVSEALFGYLAIAIGIGVFQILSGLVLGIITSRRMKDHAGMLSAAAKIAGIAMLFFFVGLLTKLLPKAFFSAAIVSLVTFLVLMLALTLRHPSHGLLLPLEVLSTIGNILSYARIMAIGIASVVLALLANMFAGMVGNIVAAAIIVILVHALNLALGIIDPTIQGLRLQYVEFFSKFYLGGGREFVPFRKTGGAFT